MIPRPRVMDATRLPPNQSPVGKISTSHSPGNCESHETSVAGGPSASSRKGDSNRMSSPRDGRPAAPENPEVNESATPRSGEALMEHHDLQPEAVRAGPFGPERRGVRDPVIERWKRRARRSIELLELPQRPDQVLDKAEPAALVGEGRAATQVPVSPGAGVADDGQQFVIGQSGCVAAGADHLPVHPVKLTGVARRDRSGPEGGQRT